MPDPKVDRFKQRGTFFFWCDKSEMRNYPGWNISADHAGCEYLRELFSLMLNSEWSTKKTLKATRPPKEMCNTVKKLFVPKEWTIHCKKMEYDKPALWRWEDNWNFPKLVCGVEKLEEISLAILEISLGKGDFCVKSSDQKLHGQNLDNVAIWFWPTTEIP